MNPFVLSVSFVVKKIVDQKLILELKAVDSLLPIHEAQLLTYMRLATISTGLPINFNVTRLKDGIKRFVL
jgi:GxxExxY protein